MRYRILYWLGLMITECYVLASSKEKAVQKFCDVTGHSEEDVIKVEWIDESKRYIKYEGITF